MADILTIVGSVALIVGLGLVHIGLGIAAVGALCLFTARGLSGSTE